VVYHQCPNRRSHSGTTPLSCRMRIQRRAYTHTSSESTLFGRTVRDSGVSARLLGMSTIRPIATIVLANPSWLKEMTSTVCASVTRPGRQSGFHIFGRAIRAVHPRQSWRRNTPGSTLPQPASPRRGPVGGTP
jgi:hypothetical protein